MKYLKTLTARTKRMFAIPLLLLVIAMMAIQPAAVYSQATNQDWTPPVNISKTGGATDPVIVVDTKGVKQAIWVDSYNGYMFAKEDANGWTTPARVSFPFSPIVNPRSTAAPVYPVPKLIADPNGRIHAFWIDDKNVLYHSSVSEAAFGMGAGWSSKRALTDSAIAFDVSMDADGTVHLAYIHNIDSYNAAAGVYYRALTRSFYWGNPVSLVSSPYFRSISADTANINITTAITQDTRDVYVAWDNQLRNRISVIQSTDAGQNWGQPVIVDGPEVSTGPVAPRDIKIGASGSNAVLVWQVDQPGSSCTQNYKWSNDAGKSWQGPGRMLTNIQGCADQNQFVVSSNGAIFLMTRILGQVYLHAWNGSRWSDPQYQEILSSFIDQETYNLVSLTGQSAIMSADNTINVIGYDTGSGGDIWMTSRQLGSVDGWFSSPNAWSLPTILSTSSGDRFAEGLVADQNGFVHMVWSQNGSGAAGGGNSALMYARWDGRTWTTPLMVFGGPGRNVNPPSMDISNNMLYVVFANPATGDISFTSVSTNQATSQAAWTPPAVLPAPRHAADSPQIHVTSDGSLYVVYSEPINESRGIYITHSTDGGVTWSNPSVVFDAVKANWPVVDYPQLTFTDSQHLYLLFTQYALPGRNTPVGVYYTNSNDGGVTWSDPQQVTNQPTYWSDIRGVGASTVHVVWQELNNGAYTVWHNTTTDNGQTWVGKNSVSNSPMQAMLSPLIVDSAGKLHMLQSLNEEQGSVTFTHWIWNAPQWSISDQTKFQTSMSSNNNVNALMGATTGDGRLVMVYSIATPSVNDPTIIANTVYSVQRNFQPEGQSAEAAAAAPVVAANPSPAPTLQPTTAPTTIVATAPSLLAAPVHENLPVPKTTPVSTLTQYIGLILGIAVTIVVVVIISIFGISSVKRRGLR